MFCDLYCYETLPLNMNNPGPTQLIPTMHTDDTYNEVDSWDDHIDKMTLDNFDTDSILSQSYNGNCIISALDMEIVAYKFGIRTKYNKSW